MFSLTQDRIDFSHRSDELEWLDGADLDSAELEAVLGDLARLNGASLGHRPVLKWLRRAVGKTPTGPPPTLIDVGCGYGDLLRVIRRWAHRRGLAIHLRGIDLNPETIRIARAATDAADQIDFEVADFFKFQSAQPISFVVSSLVAHHFSDAMIVEFLRRMEATAPGGWLIYDLRRSAILYRLIGLIGRAARLHPHVIHDGQISVARALTRTEWEERLAAAAIPRRSVEVRQFLFRFSIGRLR